MRRLPIELDRASSNSLTGQIQAEIRRRVIGGTLHPGTRLPSTRQMASDLNVSRSVAVEAYEQLTAEGYLMSARGSGTQVAPNPVPVAPAGADLYDRAASSVPTPPRWDLRTGGADTSSFPRNEWLKCYTAALSSASRDDLDYPALRGSMALREALAGYLGRVRSVHSSPTDVMVTAGFAQGLMLLCQSLPHLGFRSLAVEDPGHVGQRRFIEGNGLSQVPVPVDDEGIVVEHLERTGARAVLVTAVHQFPTGVTMSRARREQLVRWAERVDGIIIEDDYDGEFWFEHAECPPALQSHARDRIVYAGSGSKTLVPGLRLGWLVLPPHLTDLVVRIRSNYDLGIDVLMQGAFAEMVTTGMFDRHLRRVRSRYHSRRTLLANALATHLPMATLSGARAGLHAYVHLPDGVDEAALVTAAGRHSVLVRGGMHYQHGSGRRRPGLVIGYAGLSLTAIEEAVFALRKALDEQLAPGSLLGDPRLGDLRVNPVGSPLAAT